MRKFGLDQVLQGLPPPTAPLVEAIVEEAERCNVRVYLVGGPVRDLLLERPIRDVDLVVEAGQPIDAGALADRVLPEGGRLVRHERFGTLTVSAGEARVDLANSRREAYARPGALPKVEPGTAARAASKICAASVDAFSLTLSASRLASAISCSTRRRPSRSISAVVSWASLTSRSASARASATRSLDAVLAPSSASSTRSNSSAERLSAFARIASARV